MEILIGLKTKEENKINKLLKYTIFLLTSLGLIITSLELYLSFQEKSLCKSESCFVVHSYDRYGILNSLGVFFFFVLFLLTIPEVFLKNYRTFSFFRKVRFFLLSVAILIEGYLVGFQTWLIGEFCSFCLGIGAIILSVFICEIIYQKAKFVGFLITCGFLSIFLSMFFVGERLKPLNFEFPILVYKENCPHCKEVIEYVKKNEIPIKTYNVKEVYSLLNFLKINEVPILIYKEDKDLFFFVGKNSILEWLQKNYRAFKNYSLIEKNLNLEGQISKGSKIYKSRDLDLKPANMTLNTTAGKTQVRKEEPKDVMFENGKKNESKENILVPIPSQEGACRIDKGC